MNTNALQEKLQVLSQGQTSNWHQKAIERKQNRKWLRYSGNVAKRVLAAIEEQDGMNQRKLAEQVGVSPQHISKIVKGEENLTLETIAKLSESLGVELISFPEYKYSKSTIATTISYPVGSSGSASFYTAIPDDELQTASTPMPATFYAMAA